MFVSLIGTRYLVPWLQARGVGQPIRLDGPRGHITKAGTPTMGGAAVVAAAVVGYVVSHLRAETVMTRSGIVLLAAVSAAGLVGLADDWIKVSRERNLGLNKRAKLIGLIAVGVGFAAASVWWVNLDAAIGFTRLSGNALRVPAAVWIPVGCAHHSGHFQRREPDRRPGRPCRRRRFSGFRRVRGRRLLGIPSPDLL